MSAAGLEISRDGPTLAAVIDRGHANSFSTPMIEALIEALIAAESDPEARFLLIRARGPAFCLGRDPEGTTPDELRALGERIATLNGALRRSRLIVISEVAGDAAGFGVGIIAASDVAVASSAARLWFPEMDNGLPPAVVISWLVHLMPRKLAFDMVTTGRPLSAEEALSAGLLTEVAPASALGALAEDRLAALAKLDADSLRDCKRLLLHAEHVEERDAPRWAGDALALATLRLRSKSQ